MSKSNAHASRSATDRSRRASGRGTGSVSPTMVAASLRSVLAQMSDEQLSRYKQAFQSQDQDEDGYLNLGQAMQALQSCGLSVSSGAMLDSLDDLEVAQEGDLEASAWEVEQNRRRRRRRRNSLEQAEETLIPVHIPGEDPSEQKQSVGPPPTLSRNSSTGLPALEAVPPNSSLKTPTIDISTFLNLLNRPGTNPSTAQSVGLAGTRTQSGAFRAPDRAPSVLAPNTTGLRLAPSQRQGNSSTNAGHSREGGSAEWSHAGYQAASNSTAERRPYASVVSGGLAHSSSGGTGSPRPSMRLRDHQQSFRVSEHAALPPALIAGMSKRGLVPAAGDDLDDDDEFDPEQDLLAAFHTFDPSKSGVMTCKNLVALLTHMGEKWSEEEAIEMAEEVDVRREGRFSYASLCRKLLSRE